MPFDKISFKNEILEYPESLEIFTENFEIGFNKMVATMIPTLPADTLFWGLVLRNELSITIQNINNGTTEISEFVEFFHTALESKAAAMALAITNLGTFTAGPPTDIIDLRRDAENDFKFDSVSEAYDDVIDLVVLWLQTGTATNNSTGVTITWN
jgi:hypothetical protein